MDKERIEARKTAVRRTLLALACSSIEWYDFLLYATAAAIAFPSVFFPKTLLPIVALLASYSTLAVGFVARPVGAALFGHFGDRRGRRSALAAALILMGVASTLIGCLPSYHTAGIAAPLGLIAMRFLQGLAVGGQWAGAALLATESAPKASRGLFGSFPQMGVPAGTLLATAAMFIVSASMTSEAFLAYGWRIPFLLSIAFVVLGLFMRFRAGRTELTTLAERTVDSQQAGRRKGAEGPPALDALKQYPARIFVVGGTFVSTNAMLYIVISYIVAYGTGPSGPKLTQTAVLGAVMLSQLFKLPALAWAGSLSDRFGRKRIFQVGIALSSGWLFIVFAAMETRSFLWITSSLLVSALFTSLSYGGLSALFAEQFPARVRYSATSLAYQLGSIGGGALAPIVATALFAHFHSNVAVAAYVSGLGLVSIACVRHLQETVGRELDGTSGVATAV